MPLGKATNLATVARVREGTMYITEANSSVIDLAAFKANANIDKALLELKKPQSNIDIHTVVDNLEAVWDDAQAVSYTNTSVQHAAMTIDGFGARTVHRDLRVRPP